MSKKKSKNSLEKSLEKKLLLSSWFLIAVGTICSIVLIVFNVFMITSKSTISVIPKAEYSVPSPRMDHSVCTLCGADVTGREQWHMEKHSEKGEPANFQTIVDHI